jgi:hypothetical protein
MYTGPYLVLGSERDRLAVRDCTMPPDENLTPEKARLTQVLHAGHGSNCLQKYARAGTPQGSTTAAEIETSAPEFTDSAPLGAPGGSMPVAVQGAGHSDPMSARTA